MSKKIVGWVLAGVALASAVYQSPMVTQSGLYTWIDIALLAVFGIWFLLI